MTRVILSSVVGKKNQDAGPKAKNDIEKILVDQGYERLNLEISRNKFAKLLYSFYGINRLFKGEDPDEIVFQYPIYSVFLTKKFVKAIRKYTHAKLVFIVHDVEALRGYFEDPKFYKNEIDIFNSTDGMIVHNRKMREWLVDNGVQVPMVELGIFDYINPQPIVKSAEFNKSLCFAGNLVEKKAGFIQNLPWVKVHINVFGPNPLGNYPSCVNYCGVYPSDELPLYMKENFGLIWDGNSIRSCEGIYGQYMQYNAPHKTSLYLSSGMPIIVWKKAAVAEFIEKGKLGITVEDLSKLDGVLESLTQEDYTEMKNNALAIAQKLREGFYITTAMSKVHKVI